jgi:hypothetical protein
VYKFWNKFKNKINHGFALTYNTLKNVMQMNLKFFYQFFVFSAFPPLPGYLPKNIPAGIFA